MIRKQKQMRYIKDGDVRNYPSGLTRNQLVSGSCWNSTTRIVGLEINALVGFGFYVNDNPTMIRIMHPGDPRQNETAMRKFTFPSSVLSMSPIYSLRMDAESMKRLIDWNNAYPGNEIWLFIDYINEETE